MTMPIPPPILVSASDLERLEDLLERPAARAVPGSAALRAELERADSVEPSAMPADVITMNSTARFCDDASGDEHTLSLVYPHQADGTPGRVSILAPVGSALLGLRVGQSIDWSVPGGRSLRLRVLEVRRD